MLWPAILKGVEKRNQFIDESLIAARQVRDELARVKADSDAILEQHVLNRQHPCRSGKIARQNSGSSEG